MVESPDIPMKIIKMFDSKFKNHNIAKPSILDLHPVDIYRGGSDSESEEELEIPAEEPDEVKLKSGIDRLAKEFELYQPQSSASELAITAPLTSRSLSNILKSDKIHISLDESIGDTNTIPK
jgi:hypothetical protein